MEDPALYQQSNGVLRRDEAKLIGEYQKMIQLRQDGNDSLLDVGSGPGDVLVDLIRPILPTTHGQIVGVDVSRRMFEHASRQYAYCDRVHFDVLDIGVEHIPLNYREKFDHITSFYCLHWLQNQRQALQNIYDLLTPGGDCFIVFLGSHTLFDSYVHLAQHQRWKKYMFDLKNIIPISQYQEDLWTFYENLFQEVGFVNENIEIRQRAFVYQGFTMVTDHLASVNAFIHRLPLEERAEYIKGISTFYEKLGLAKNEKYALPHRLVVAYARKPNRSSDF